MTDAQPAEQARTGLIAAVTGKAKEVVGAVLGNDSLAVEGQLQQAEAAARKEAGATRAVAEARAESAAETLSREHANADAQKQALNTAAESREDQVRREAAAQRSATSTQVELDKALEASTVEQRASADRAAAAAQVQADRARADQDAERARQEHREKYESAEAAEQAAARARAEADRLGADAGLSGT